MEKRKPSYDLARIKAVFSSVQALAMTNVALRDATRLGFDRRAVVDIVQRMDRGMFVKSMTTYVDHRKWQDVYHVPIDDMTLYVKFQDDAVTEFFVVSFKEK